MGRMLLLAQPRFLQLLRPLSATSSSFRVFWIQTSNPQPGASFRTLRPTLPNKSERGEIGGIGIFPFKRICGKSQGNE